MRLRLALLLKIAAFLLGCLCSAVLAFGLYIWLGFDVSKIEAEATRHISEQSGHSLRIEDGLQLAMWPRPALRLNAATLTEKGSDKPFARLGPTRFTLALAPLLRREIIIEHMHGEGAELDLQRSRGGRWNIADLGDKLAKSFADAAFPAASLRLREITLRQSTLRLRDEASGLSAELSGLQLSTISLQDSARGTLQLSARIKGSGPAVDGMIQLDSAYRLPQANEAGGLDKPLLRFSGQLAGLNEVRAQLGTLSSTRDPASGAWQHDKPSLSLSGKEQARALDLALELPALRWLDGTPQAASLTGKLSLAATDAEGASTWQLQLIDIAPAKTGFAAARLSARWQREAGKGGPPSATLSFSSPLRYEDERRLLRLDTLSGEAQFNSPWLTAAAQRLRFDGAASWRLAPAIKGEDERPGRIALKLMPGNATLNAEARLTSLHPLAGQLDLSARQLDADELLASGQPPGLNLPPALAEVELSGQLHADSLLLAGLTATGVDAAYAISKGRAELRDIRLLHAASKLGGTLAYSSETQRLEGQLKFDKLDTRQLATQLDLDLPVEGRADGTLTLLAQGADTRTLARSLQQQWQVRYTLPVLLGIDIAKSLRELREAWRDNKTATRRAAGDERSELASLNASARLSGDALQIDKFDASASWVSLAGSGRADLARHTLSLTTDTTPTNPAIRSFARDLLDLKGSTLPLLIGYSAGQTNVTLGARKP